MSNTHHYLLKIFSPEDIVYFAGALKPEGGGYSNPQVARLADLAPQDFSTTDAVPLEFFAINPISFTNRNIRPDGSVGSYRASCNVVNFKNFLFESDALPLELQKELIPVINEHVPLRLVTYSGGKSYHMIVSVADTLFNSKVHDPVTLYKQIWEGICEKLETVCNQYLLYKFDYNDDGSQDTKIFDRATKDPSRLSRLPMAIRTDKERVQSVVFEGGLVAADELLALSAEVKLKQYDSSKSTVNNNVDLGTFEKKLKNTSSLQFLRDRLEFPERWTSASNMYTEMFRYTLWCIDATSVPFNVLDAYLTKTVYPTILAKGYPRDPRAGVLAAYQYKGLF